MPTFYTHHLRLTDGDSYGDVAPHALINNIPERTVAILVRWNGAFPSGQVLWSKGSNRWFSVISNGEGYELIGTVNFTAKRYRGPALSNSTPTVWRWIFSTMSRSNTSNKRFNAVKGGTISEVTVSDEFGGNGGTLSDAADPFRIGRSTAGNAFISDVAFFGVWDRRLTAAECQEVVTDLSTATRQPVAAWKPRATSIGVVANYIAAGVPMTLANQALGGPIPVLTSGPDTAPPSITSFTPSTGVAGTSVTCEVEDTGTVTAATLNGVPITVFSQPSSTSFIFTVPAGATSGRLVLTSALGTATSASDFVVPVPTITGFGPTEGVEGTPVVIAVTFTDTISAVSLNGVEAVFSRPSSGSVLMFVPAGATTGQIVIEASNGTSVSADPFTVLVPEVDIRDVTGATFIDAINSIMRSVGESPVESLEDLPADGRAAVEILRTGLRELALRPWEFNYDRNRKFTPAGTLVVQDEAGDNVTLNCFVVPNDVSQAVPTVRQEQAANRTPDVSMRRARSFTLSGNKPRVFANRVRGEDGFADRDVLYMDVTRFIPFEDLPEVAKHYLTIRSARRYASEVLGSGELTSFKQGDEQAAWIELEAQFGIQERYNMFEAYENAPLSRNRNLNTGWTS